MILIDELEGRKAARSLGLKVSGVLGILLRAKYSGEIRSIQAEIAALRREAHFFIHPRLEQEALRAAGE